MKGPMGESGIAGLLGEGESIRTFSKWSWTGIDFAREITKALSEAGLELEIVRTKTGGYVVTLGMWNVLARKLGKTGNETFKLISDAVEGAGGRNKGFGRNYEFSYDSRSYSY